MPVRLPASFVTPWRLGRISYQVPRPLHGNACRLSHHKGLGCTPFARHYSGHHCCFLFLGVVRCFSSPGSRNCTLYIQAQTTRHDPCQVFPFGDPRINACLAASRGLSQPATSFIGFQRQGIHRVPFKTCRDDARARYEVHKDQPPTLGACPNHRARHKTGPQSNGSPQVTRDRSPGPERATAPLKAAQCARQPAPPPSTGHDRKAVPPA